MTIFVVGFCLGALACGISIVLYCLIGKVMPAWISYRSYSVAKDMADKDKLTVGDVVEHAIDTKWINRGFR